MKRILFFLLLIVLLGLGETNAQNRHIFADPLQKAEFPGGQEALKAYVAEHLEQLIVATDTTIHGRTIVSFVVEADGLLSDVKIMKPSHPVLDSVALKLVKDMPKWHPALMNGKPVRSQWAIPVSYRHHPSSRITRQSREQLAQKESASSVENSILYKNKALIPSKEFPALNKFSLRLFDQLRQEKQKNLVCSPVGIAALYRMLQDGAAGKVEKELQQVLGVSAEDMSAIIKDIALSSEKESGDAESEGKEKAKNPLVSIANYLAVNEKHSLLPAFVNQSRERYLAEMQSMAFDNNGLQKINRWASEQTHGMIPQLLSSLNPSALMCAVNAVSFKGLWGNAFERRNTQSGRFYPTSGKAETVSMMKTKGRFLFAENKRLKMVYLPYFNRPTQLSTMNNFGMLVLLPKKRNGINDAVDYLKGEGVKAMLKSLNWQAVDLMLPKFETDSDIDLLQLLKTMGVRHLDDSSTDNFPGISNQPLYVSESRQKAKISVNEEGTEGAAASDVVFLAGASRRAIQPSYVKFHADHPFVYLLINKDTNAIFFIGQYVDSGEKGE